MKRTILTAAAATVLALAAGPTVADDRDGYRENGMGHMTRGGQGMMQGGQGMGPGMMQGGQGMDPRMMHGRYGMGMRQGMRGRGMMGRGMGGMMSPMMMTMVFVLADTDGNGTLSLEEVLSVEERFFHHMDSDGNGELTQKEMMGFMRSMMMPGMAQEEDDSEN